ncbi:MAG: FtsW/RodA/SpoVE family cell cycle protein [Kiritimatiellia bacterium]
MKKSALALLFAVFSLVSIGMIMLCSISSHHSWCGRELSGATTGLLDKQITWAGIGLALMLVFSRVNYRRWRALAVPLIVFVTCLLILVLIPCAGFKVPGAGSLMMLGPSAQFQPSLLAGPAIVLFLAWWYQSGNLRPAALFWIPIVALCVMAGLILVEPDFTGALLIMLAGLVVLIAAGERIANIVTYVMLSLSGLIWALMQSRINVLRLAAFFTQSRPDQVCVPIPRLALAAGGWSGVGLGNAYLSSKYLSDHLCGGMMTVLIGEELGLAGLLALFGLYVILIVSGARIAVRAPDRFGKLLGLGIVSLLGFQFLLNLLAVTALIMHATLLPFVSYGALNLCLSMAGVGVLLNIASEIERKSGVCSGF